MSHCPHLYAWSAGLRSEDRPSGEGGFCEPHRPHQRERFVKVFPALLERLPELGAEIMTRQCLPCI